MKFKGTETHRRDGSAHINFTDENGTVLLTGGRYVPAADWDADQDAVIAKFAKWYREKTAVSTQTAALKGSKTLTDAEVDAKLAALKL